MFAPRLRACRSTVRYLAGATAHILRQGVTLEGTRTFTDEDLFKYGGLSGDFNPLHFDIDTARGAGFEDRLVHGMLVASQLSRLIASHFPGAVYVSQSFNFRGPVYVGDEVVTTLEATHVRASKGRYIAKFLCKCCKDDTVVVDGEATTILPTLAIAKEAVLQDDCRCNKRL